jgi:hypothetical protein
MNRSTLSLALLCCLTLGMAAATTALTSEASFWTIDPVTFYFHYGSYSTRLQHTASKTNIFYNFQPADSHADNKPLFIFFNGGPGSATSCGLMSMYTGHYTLDNQIDGGGDHYINNPYPWTQFGNLLYIDARQTGFSYSFMDNPASIQERFWEFNSHNFNCFFDASDFIRLLLRFLAAHPSLQKNPVVIVGESYGGTRATAMLHILLNYADYSNGQEMFQDPELSKEIQTHFNIVFPEYHNQIVPTTIITKQFGHQILIQPTLSMGYQDYQANIILTGPNSPLYQLGKEVGIPYDPLRYPDYFEYVGSVAKRDWYGYHKPFNWLNSFFDKAGILLQTCANLSLVTGSDITHSNGFYSSARQLAYRVININQSTTGLFMPESSKRDKLLLLQPAEQMTHLKATNIGDMSQIFGTLQPWDNYFLGLNTYANWSFHFHNVARNLGYEVQYIMPRFGRMFLKNVASVRTFVTNAKYDLVVYGPAIPPALAMHAEILEKVEHVNQQAKGIPRPGMIRLQYRNLIFPDLPNIGIRTIRFPFYNNSCHAVSLTQPEEFFSDVRTWLADNGIDVE